MRIVYRLYFGKKSLNRSTISSQGTTKKPLWRDEDDSLPAIICGHPTESYNANAKAEKSSCSTSHVVRKMGKKEERERRGGKGRQADCDLAPEKVKADQKLRQEVVTTHLTAFHLAGQNSIKQSDRGNY